MSYIFLSLIRKLLYRMIVIDIMTISLDSTPSHPYVISKIDWSGVRPIYKKLGTEFHVLTSAFGIEIDTRTQDHLDHLITTIDCVDRIIDDLPEKKKKDTKKMFATF